MLHYSRETLRGVEPATKTLIGQNLDLIIDSDNGSLISTGSMIEQRKDIRSGMLLVGQWTFMQGTEGFIREVTSFDLKSGELMVTPFFRMGEEGKPTAYPSRPAEPEEVLPLLERSQKAHLDMHAALFIEANKLILARMEKIQSKYNDDIMDVTNLAAKIIELN